MEFKGTQGPWKIIHGGFRTDDGFSVGSDNAYASRVKVTCECWPCTIIDQEHRDELLANARLIAAAPDLLKEAQRFLPVLEKLEADYPQVWYMVTQGTGIATYNGCKAAIAKALGE